MYLLCKALTEFSLLLSKFNNTKFKSSAKDFNLSLTLLPSGKAIALFKFLTLSAANLFLTNSYAVFKS